VTSCCRHTRQRRSILEHQTDKHQRYRPGIASSHGRSRRSCADPVTHALFSAQNSVKNCFIRGSVVRYVQIPKAEVDTGQRIFVVLSVAQDSVICVELLENSTRIEIREQKKLAEAADAQRAAGGAAAAAGAAK
jgi:hypothetical protein